MPSYARMKPGYSDTDNLIGSRLRLEMKRRGLTSTELAKRAEVKTSFIYDVISGKSANPSTLKLSRVADVLEVSLAYLAGSVDMSANIPARTKREDSEDCITIPRISVDVSAGGGSIVSQEYESERYYFRRSWIRDHLDAQPADLRMLHVRGDSMEPALCHNDIVLVDTTKKSLSPPGIFILFDGFGLVAKRLEYVGSKGVKRLRIMSDNPQYSTYERSLDEVAIIGRVVWFAREI